MLNTDYLLTDEQMALFITEGFLVLNNELSKPFHQQVKDQLDYVMLQEGNPGNNILPRVPDIAQFFETPLVKGALTSVLGADYYMHPHRHCHYNPPGSSDGQWHKDGIWSSMRSHRPWWVMLIYYTQDITEDLGPTAIMPGTQYYEKFLGDEGVTLLPTGKAGTTVLIHFDLWHKATKNVSNIDRYMLKFQFARVSTPESPSWNHQSKEMKLPKNQLFMHLNLWQDVWDWLRADKTISQQTEALDAPILKQLKLDLGSADTVVRARSADAVGLIGEAAADCTSELNSLILDSEERVALNAAYALGHMGIQGINALLLQLESGSNLAASRAAYGLQGAGQAAVKGLIAKLNHSDARRRALAAFVLGMHGSAASEAVPALITALTDQSEWVRRNIIEALGMIAQPGDSIVPALTSALIERVQQESSEEVKPTDNYEQTNQDYITNKIGYTSALSILRAGKYGDATLVLPALKLALSSKDRYTRAYGFEALTHLRTEESIDLLNHYLRTARWCAATHKDSLF